MNKQNKETVNITLYNVISLWQKNYRSKFRIEN